MVNVLLSLSTNMCCLAWGAQHIWMKLLKFGTLNFSSHFLQNQRRHVRLIEGEKKKKIGKERQSWATWSQQTATAHFSVLILGLTGFSMYQGIFPAALTLAEWAAVHSSRQPGEQSTLAMLTVPRQVTASRAVADAGIWATCLGQL